MNYGSQKMIIRNGGKIDMQQQHYKTLEGTSSSYIITIK